jgi:MinD-like ATPase involved in chromosome partitioning or flagellar assembly
MYVTTFYSFKGGVGRTFALVNVGVELAKTGRKVLLADFDLETPGIHTFGALGPEEPFPGVVEYVTDFMATQSAPDVRQYVYEKPELGKEGGQMWIMPAGRGNDDYRQRLASINWQSLYRDMDGYMFFEDLKAQWKEAFNPDYVLIDSRTGHTDAEGICTRQLPDAVVVLFFPNEQNLCGLKEVVRDIRTEAERTRKDKTPVSLHFVMSNVPDLDDEDGILRKRIQEFRRALGYETLSRIHNYPSLALLNQTIFTLERTKSRLAKEYRRLKDQIVDENDEDAEGVVRFLGQLDRPRFFARRWKMANVEKRLQSIRKMHADNGEAMFLLGVVRKDQGDLNEAMALFDHAMTFGYQANAVLLERATCHSMLGDRARTAEDVQGLLELPDLGDLGLYQAVQLLNPDDQQLLARVPQSKAFKTLDVDEKFLVAKAMFEKGAIESSADVFRALTDNPNTPNGLRKGSRGHLMRALMGLSNVDQAMRVFSPTRPSLDELGIQDAFNYAMAEWAHTGDIPKDLFARVLELDASDQGVPSANYEQYANYEQCLAVSCWAVGETSKAAERIANAEEYAQEIRKTEFSCWRYQEVTREEFLEDCQEIRKLISTGEGRPSFFPGE